MVTGIKRSKEDLQIIAAHIADMTRQFNLQEGFTAEDDRLPKRFHKEPLPEGGSLSEGDMEQMLQDCYRIRGWSQQGTPQTA